MSDKPRDWPNVAKAARDLAAEEAVRGIVALEPLVMSEAAMTDSEKLRRVARALNSLQRIARALENVGAPTRVNEL